MLRKLSEEDITARTQLRSSALRGLRQNLTEQYPALVPYLDDIFPKKQPVLQLKCRNHIELICSPPPNSIALFFTIGGNDTFIPSLRLIHMYPFILPTVQVDNGAIKHGIHLLMMIYFPSDMKIFFM
jgi:PUA domain protein